ncbi:Olfactory receptor 2T1 [Heterocephalus glaber]|uniref:Olfactory receptor 2T1 n=1 Tax=Heterocephalus glaber TaxID=10181 RepID=G5C7Q4_HETGA|nr:Olfactory receptor 2T1 [Heterocephalus glaber]
MVGAMERHNISSTHFTILGLFTRKESAHLLFATISAIFLTTLLANGMMVFLIHTDSHLHTPMYFLLSHLSLIDMMYISTMVPKMLGRRTISFVGCTAPQFLYLTLVGVKFFLLGLMAYDLYMAFCHSLPYLVLMGCWVCWMIIACSWLGDSLDGFLLIPIIMRFPICGPWEIHHFFCEKPAVLYLACADTALYETVMYNVCVLYADASHSVLCGDHFLCLLPDHSPPHEFHGGQEEGLCHLLIPHAYCDPVLLGHHVHLHAATLLPHTSPG